MVVLQLFPRFPWNAPSAAQQLTAATFHADGQHHSLSSLQMAMMVKLHTVLHTAYCPLLQDLNTPHPTTRAGATNCWKLGFFVCRCVMLSSTGCLLLWILVGVFPLQRTKIPCQPCLLSARSHTPLVEERLVNTDLMPPCLRVRLHGFTSHCSTSSRFARSVVFGA